MTAVMAARLFIGRDFAISRSYRIPFLFSAVSAIMSLLTFRFVAKLIGSSPLIGDASGYFGFVVVGLALTNVLDSAVTGPAQAARNEQIQGTLEVLAAQPLRPASLAIGWTAYPVLFGFANGVILILLAGVMGFRLATPDFLAGLIAIVASAAVFTAIGILGAAIVLVFQQGAAILQWVTSTLALIGGVYFPVKLLPGWMAWLAEASPLTHSVRAVRGALLDGKTVPEIGGDLLALGILALVLLPVAIAAFTAALNRARSKGTIATY